SPCPSSMRVKATGQGSSGGKTPGFAKTRIFLSFPLFYSLPAVHPLFLIGIMRIFVGANREGLCF
ncbi:hypothetical protein SJ550_26710, partial [Serratia marcescens]